MNGIQRGVLQGTEAYKYTWVVIRNEEPCIDHKATEPCPEAYNRKLDCGVPTVLLRVAIQESKEVREKQADQKCLQEGLGTQPECNGEIQLRC